GVQSNPTDDHLEGCLARVLVFRHRGVRAERDQSLTQDMLVAAPDGPGASTAGRVRRQFLLLPSKSLQGHLLHTNSVTVTDRARWPGDAAAPLTLCGCPAQLAVCGVRRIG